MELLDESNLADYLVRQGRLAQAHGVRVRQLAGGVSNVVLYVDGPGELGLPIVVKQVRRQLRTPQPWFSTPERIWREVAFLKACQQVLAGVQLPIQLPEVLWEDRANYAFAMTAAPPGHRTWKSLLLQGEVDPQVARWCGQVLAQLHTRTWNRPDLAPELDDRQVFDQLRLDPYYRFVAERDPQARPHLERLIQEGLTRRHSLVHADFSPKNLLVYPGGLMMVDFETGHFGDPAFDLGFFHAHLVLKCFHAQHQGLDRAAYLKLLEAFWETYAAAMQAHLDQEAWLGMKQRFLAHLAGCLLARVAGKSQIDYLHHPPARATVRQLALALWEGKLHDPARLAQWLPPWLESFRQ